jgi:cystathionine beta-lyase
MPSFAALADQITAEELRARGSVKWTGGGPGVIGAFIAEMDFGYLSDHAAAELADACARWQADRYGWAVNSAWIRPLADVISGLRAAIALYSEPGSPVILPTPAYMPFLKVPASMGREIIQVPMITGADGRAVLDLAGLDAAFRRGGHLLVLCNPCNPVGRVYQAAELAAVAAVVAANNGRVFADEVHAPLIYPGGAHVPYASISEQAAAHTVTTTSASKGWNLPGLKCAQLIFSNHRDAEVWSRDAYAFEHGASILGVRASTAAYRDGGPWLAEVVDYLDGSRLLLAELLRQQLPAIRYQPPEGTYLAWLDCRALFPAAQFPAANEFRAADDPAAQAGAEGDTTAADGGTSPAAFFLAKAEVMLTDGADCGEAGRDHVRLNFATPRPILAEIVRRLAAAAVAVG